MPADCAGMSFVEYDADRTRERLARAGLLAALTPLSGARPDAELVAAAGRRAARGRPVAEHVVDGR